MAERPFEDDIEVTPAMMQAALDYLDLHLDDGHPFLGCEKITALFRTMRAAQLRAAIDVGAGSVIASEGSGKLVPDGPQPPPGHAW